MNRMLDLLLTGGRGRQALAARLHAIVWARRLFRGGSDVPEMRLLNDIDLRGRVALDVGAHAGNWSNNLARRVGSHGFVVAYEALPHYGQSLALTMRLLRRRNVRVQCVAVGDSVGAISLRWRSASNQLLTGRTHIEPNAPSTVGVIEVPMVTLDLDLQEIDVKLTDVGFVKIDVEGAELQVLRGASELLRVGQPVVYLETEPEWLERLGSSVKEVFGEMATHGYQPHLVSESGPLPTTADEYLEQYTKDRTYNNVLFIPAPRGESNHPGAQT